MRVLYFKKKNKKYHEFVVCNDSFIKLYFKYYHATKEFINCDARSYVFWRFLKRRGENKYYHFGKPQTTNWFYGYPKEIAK